MGYSLSIVLQNFLLLLFVLALVSPKRWKVSLRHLTSYLFNMFRFRLTQRRPI